MDPPDALAPTCMPTREAFVRWCVKHNMPQLRLARPDDPAARPLLTGLADEYARIYGEKADGELSRRAE